MEKKQQVSIGITGLAVTCAVGIAAIYLIKKNPEMDKEQAFEEVKKSSIIEEIYNIVVNLSRDILEAVYTKIKTFILETLFNFKMDVHEKRVDWSV